MAWIVPFIKGVGSALGWAAKGSTAAKAGTFGASVGKGLGFLGKSAVGGSIASAFAQRNARKSFDASREEYGRRWQRTVDDMRRAGINPILAAKTGVGGPGAQMSSFGDSAYQTGVNSATAYSKDQLQKQQVILAEEQAYEAISKMGLNNTQQEYVEKQISKMLHDTEQSEAHAAILKEQLKEWRNHGKISGKEYGGIITVIDRLLGRRPAN